MSDWRLLMTPKAQYIALRLEAGLSYSGSLGLCFQRESGVGIIQYFRMLAKLRAPRLVAGNKGASNSVFKPHTQPQCTSNRPETSAMDFKFA